MSFEKDNDFILELKRFFNESDVKKILISSAEPVTNANINKRTGRQCIGVPHTRPRKILKRGSLSNYKSIILQFARYKADHLGVDAPINEDIADKYDTDRLRNKRNQTSLTNIRVLNKYVFIPTLNLELKKPIAIGQESYSNKPQLTHYDIASTLKYLWQNCRNRDHVFKIFLIYYTGLRSAEALDITYRDIVNAWTDTHIVLSVRRGKNKSTRSVYLFQGAPTYFFRKHLIPYLNLKMIKLLCENKNKTVEDFLDSEKIFSDSSYQACQKEFRKCLRLVVMLEDDNDDILKGAGLHSIRADYSTRCLGLLTRYCNNEIWVAIKIVSLLMGHTNIKNVFRHYINLGYNQTDNSSIETTPPPDEEGGGGGGGGGDDEDGMNVFKHLKCGSTVINALSNRKKCHTNVNKLIHIYDSCFIIPSHLKKLPTTTHPLNRLIYV